MNALRASIPTPSPLFFLRTPRHACPERSRPAAGCATLTCGYEYECLSGISFDTSG
ncbi:MAG: hypothetical protein LBT25_07585 [Candidatus Symbiothrix sp.]|nr:hypothetical protein [Candidatus Symbiothrix sp.]